MSDNSKMGVDEKGFVLYNNFKLPCKLVDVDNLEFVDKDKRRSAERGSRLVSIPILSFLQLIIPMNSKVCDDCHVDAEPVIRVIEGDVIAWLFECPKCDNTWRVIDGGN